MDKFNNFTEFYNNPYTREMTKGFSIIANYAASNLLNSCEYLKGLLNGSDSSDEITAQYIGAIDTICCQLQRTGAFCDAITAEPTNFRKLQAESYLNNFVRGCQGILGDTHKIYVNIRQDFVFSSVSNLLDLLILGFMRKACSSFVFMGAGYSAPLSFELSACVKNGIPEITVYTNANSQKRDYDSMGAQDFFDDFFTEISGMISQKLNVETKISPGYMTIQFRSDEGDDTIIAEQPKLQLLNDGRSIFKIMLGDI